MGTAILLMEILICALVGVISFVLLSGDMKGKVKKGYNTLKERNHEKNYYNLDKKSSYQEIRDNLMAWGANYRLGKNFSPFDFMLMKLAFALGGGLLGLLIDPFLIVIGVVLGYFLPGYAIKHYDKVDNDDMLEDICQIFGIVALQLKNNIYISNVIYECHLSTEHPRLKKALLELSLEIESVNNPIEAIHNFKAKFNNEHINSFGTALEQMQEYGTALNMLENMQEQMKGINEAIAIRAEEEEKNRGFLISTICFLGAIAFLVYCVYLGFGGVGSLF